MVTDVFHEIQGGGPLKQGGMEDKEREVSFFGEMERKESPRGCTGFLGDSLYKEKRDSPSQSRWGSWGMQGSEIVNCTATV